RKRFNQSVQSNPPNLPPRRYLPVNLAKLACRLVVLACLLVALTPFARADNWPQWHGPDNDGHSKEKGLPISWSETKNIAWKLDLPGNGGSTPAVWGDHIFLTSAEGNNLVFLCLKTDGKLLWKRTIAPAVRLSIMKGEGNDATPSPSTDGKHVFVYFGTGDFLCFDFDGKEIWKFNAQER